MTFVPGDLGHIAEHNSLRLGVNTLAAQAVEIIANPTNFPGIDPTGVLDSSSALQTSLNAVPAGGVWRLPPGTYKASGLSVSGRGITLKTTGAHIIQGSDAAILRLVGAWDTTYALTSVTNTARTYNGGSRNMGTLTFSSAPAWQAGDVVKVFSDDVIPEAVTKVDGTAVRQGEFGTVAEIVSNVVYLMGPVMDTYTTSPRVARLQSHPFLIEGWSSQTPDSGMATWTSQQVVISDALAPTVRSARVTQGCGIGFNIVSCYAYRIDGLDIAYLKDNAGANQYGYGVGDNNSQAGVITGLVARNVRHAFTDDSPYVLAGSTVVGGYGRSRGATIIGGRAYGTFGIAWNTHHAGERHHFVDCQADGCDTGAGFRGRYHKVTRLLANGCRVGINVYADDATALTYGHEFDDCTVVNARLDAAWIKSTTRDGRLTAVIRGGFYQSTVRALQVTKSWVKVERKARFVSMVGALTSSTRVVKVTDSALVFDGAEVDMSGVSSGSTLAHVGLDDSTSSVTGKGLSLILPGTASRTPTPIIGVVGNLGTVTLRDVDYSGTPTTAFVGDVATGSRVAYFTPAVPAGSSITI